LLNESSTAGPDWFAAAEPDAPEPSAWAAKTVAGSDDNASAPPWSAEPGDSTVGRSGGAGSARRERSSGSGFGGRGGRSGGARSGRQSSDSPDKPKPQLSPEKLEQRAKNILLYHLGRSMRTRSQLAERLKRKEIPDDIAEAVLDRFEELHLLDDAQYAETFVRSRHQERGLAKRALGYELRKRGIDGEVAQEALETLDEDQELATARRLVDSRMRSTTNLDPQVRIRRLVGMLARKGYSGSMSMRVVREAMAAEGERLDAELQAELDSAEPDDPE
jgi:regulatory protein